MKLEILNNIKRSSHKESCIKNGKLVSFICKDLDNGSIINVGAGVLNHNERKFIIDNPSLYLGKAIAYKYLPLGIKDKPRFPTFVTFRDDK